MISMIEEMEVNSEGTYCIFPFSGLYLICSFFLNFESNLLYSLLSFFYSIFLTLFICLFLYFSSFILFIIIVYQVSWSADSNYLVSCSKDSTIKLWSVKNTKKALHTLPGHEDEVRIAYYYKSIIFAAVIFSIFALSKKFLICP